MNRINSFNISLVTFSIISVCILNLHLYSMWTRSMHSDISKLEKIGFVLEFLFFLLINILLFL